LLNPALKGAMDQGIIIPQEAIDRIKLAKEEQTQFNKEMAIASTLTGMLSNTFQSAFEGMLNTGKVSFRGIIDGLKALIIRLIAAAAAAAVLAAILGGLGMGSFTLSGGGFLKGFKELFSSMSGIPKFAEGGMVTGLTTAILGDNPSGKEAVIPFEKMGSFLSQYGTGGSQDMRVEVVGKISGEDIFFSGLNYSNGRNKIIGG
jgi:ammonia channel protein AmtB